MKQPRISEIFGPTIQGEGAVIGEATIFVRTGGCDYRCSWCDTMHAVDPIHAKEWRAMSAEDICLAVNALTNGARTKPTITLSGGNPAMQPLRETCQRLKAMGHRLIIETQGTLIPEWLDLIDVVSVSPKPPSAQIKFDEAKHLAFMRAAGARAVLKIVIGNDEDFEWARRTAKLTPHVPVFLQPCNLNPNATEPADLMTAYRWLVEKALRDEWYTARILPQLHALTWGGERAR